MSATAELEMLQKKRRELENEQTSLEQKEQATKENVRKLFEKLTVQLEEKIKAKNEVIEKLESLKRDLEKRLDELQDNRESSLMPKEARPEQEVEEKHEESTEQVIERARALVADGNQELSSEEQKKGAKKKKSASGHRIHQTPTREPLHWFSLK